MKALEFPLLCDENIHCGVIDDCVERGLDVMSVRDAGLAGATDLEILRFAHANGRVIVTHDADFGALAVHAGEPVIGIIFLRPGHINPYFVLETLDAVAAGAHEVEAPFLLVAERRDDHVRVRVRSL